MDALQLACGSSDGLGSRQLGYTARRCSGDVGELSGCGLGIDTELRYHGRISFVMGAGIMSKMLVVRKTSAWISEEGGRGGEHVHRAGRVRAWVRETADTRH